MATQLQEPNLPARLDRKASSTGHDRSECPSISEKDHQEAEWDGHEASPSSWKEEEQDIGPRTSLAWPEEHRRIRSDLESKPTGNHDRPVVEDSLSAGRAAQSHTDSATVDVNEKEMRPVDGQGRGATTFGVFRLRPSEDDEPQ